MADDWWLILYIYIYIYNRISSRMNACWQTHWAIEDQAKNFNSITYRPHCQYGCTPGSGDIGVCWCWFLCTGNRELILDWKDICCSSAECRLRTQGLWNRISTDWMHTDKPTGLYMLPFCLLPYETVWSLVAGESVALNHLFPRFQWWHRWQLKKGYPILQFRGNYFYLHTQFVWIIFWYWVVRKLTMMQFANVSLHHN